MTTVKEFKDLGVEFVIGDEFEAVENKSPTTVTRRVAVIFNDGEFPNVVILSFAWRPLYTLPDNPKFKYEVNTTPHQWRPLLDQSVDIYACDDCYDNSEITIKYVDAHVSGDKAKGGVIPNNILGKMHEVDKGEAFTPNKPVFTQEMADGGQPPKIGVMVSYPTGEGELILAADTNGICIVIEDGVYKRVGIDALKPIDSSTPKQKAVDAACKSINQDNNTIVVNIVSDLYDKGFIKC